MLIVGAKGFAKEVLEVCQENNFLENLVFFDDINSDMPSHLYEKFPILKSKEQAKDYFKSTDNRFVLGLGQPELRKMLCDIFIGLGGELTTLISKTAKVGSFGVSIGKGTNILQNAIISNDVRIGKGCLVYYNTTITHDVVLGDFVEVSPNATILGRAKVGNATSIGSHAVILPDLTIGNNVVIGAGSIVTKNIPDNVTVIGVPGVIKT